MDWLESCKQSLVKNEIKKAIPDEMVSTGVGDRSPTSKVNNVDDKLEHTKENCEPVRNQSEPITKTYTITEISAGKHLENAQLQKETHHNDSSMTMDIHSSSYHENSVGAANGNISKSREKTSHRNASNNKQECSQLSTDTVEVSSKSTKKKQPASSKGSKEDTPIAGGTEDIGKTATGKLKKRKRVAETDPDDVESDTKKVKVSKKAAATKGKRFLILFFSS